MKKVLKWVAIVVIALILLCVGGVLMSSGEWDVQRSLTVNATPAEIHAYSGDYDKWPVWSPWENADPDMVITVDGPSSGVGATRSWKSKTQGNGSMTITASDPAKGVDYDITIEGMPSFKGAITYATDSSEGTTSVTWRNWGTAEGFTGKMFAMGADAMLGANLDQGLRALADAVVKKK